MSDLRNLPAAKTDQLLTIITRILVKLEGRELQKILDSKKLSGKVEIGVIRQLCIELFKRGDFKRLVVAASKTTDESQHTAHNLQLLGEALLSIQHTQWAEPIYQKAVQVSRKAFGPNHLQTAVIMTDLAGVYHVLGKSDEAVKLANQATEILQNETSEEGQLYLARTLGNLAKIFQDKKQLPQALKLYKQALEIREIYESQVSTKTISLFQLIGFVYIEMGKPRYALSYFERSFIAFYHITDSLYNENTANALKLVVATLNAVSEKLNDESIYEKYVHCLTALNEISS